MEHNVLIEFVIWTFTSWTNFGKVFLLCMLISPSIRYERRS